MRLAVDGVEIFAATGGRTHDRAQPLIVFLHGAGLDHSVWALLARWFAHRGWAVLAPDLPGHGRSGGEPLVSIGAMADWTAGLIEVAGAREVDRHRPIHGVADRARDGIATSGASECNRTDRSRGRHAGIARAA